MPKNTILLKMLDRLFAGLTSGPNLNCRPHSSRQRLDWMQLGRLQDISPGEALCQLLSKKQATQLRARVSAPSNSSKAANGKKRPSSKKLSAVETESAVASENEAIPDDVSPEQDQQQQAWVNQQTLLTKLRALAEDARDYEQDTGAHVLHVGFPLLSLPPSSGASGKPGMGGSKRLLAPIAFISVSLEMRAGPNPVVAIEGLHDGALFLVPNEALFAWLERQTGQAVLPDSLETITDHHEPGTNNQELPATDSDSDQVPSAEVASNAASLDPWVELNDLVRRVATALHLPPCELTAESLAQLLHAPRGDDENAQAEIVPAAVLGLFPMNNQSLLRDMQAMVAAPDLPAGPVQNFLVTDITQNPSSTACDTSNAAETTRTAISNPGATGGKTPERLISMADPCQAHAVRLARECQGLVVHGPPGTGKSQTITNIIGDHLARGERVLMVCDKRTALDVVAKRLEHLGLGSLCALIHDSQHDQRDLYRQVREQLEGLSQTTVDQRSATQLKTFDKQAARLTDQLRQAWSLVMARNPQRLVSFHERMGEWLECRPASSESILAEQDSTQKNSTPATTMGTTALLATPDGVDQFHSHVAEIRDIAGRAIEIQYASHPWRTCASMPLTTFLERSAVSIRNSMTSIVTAATALDAAEFLRGCEQFVVPGDNGKSPGIGSPIKYDFARQREELQQLVTQLQRSLREIAPGLRQKWANLSVAALQRANEQFEAVIPSRHIVRTAALDPELASIARHGGQSVVDTAAQVGSLQEYLATCDAWYSWLRLGINNRAKTIIRSYGLVPGKAAATRLLNFVSGVRARQTLSTVLEELCRVDETPRPETEANQPSSPSPRQAWPDDMELLSKCDQVELLLNVLVSVTVSPTLAGAADRVRKALTNPNDDLVPVLERSVARIRALDNLQQVAIQSGLVGQGWINGLLQQAARGESILPATQLLASSVDSLGEVLKIQRKLAELPPVLQQATQQAIATARDVEAAIASVRHQILTGDIQQWLTSTPELQAFDGDQLSNLCRETYRLDEEKQACARDVVSNLWIERQRERLLASTGSRLNSLGADLRRRLTSRGERAMRLRQVIAIGSKIEGGDPLFDLRPVWMASPETVAQIFPRDALFDVVIFDEASQCRLEEALPVLTRAKRVVIAGDPKQLPPTRFFESTVVTSDNQEADADQDLFEAHQSEVEDLLTAALSIDIQESYLDVHYRSRNADLVEFSNQQFYGSRLQAIPAYPGHQITQAPITLYQVDGTYEDRRNVAEAEQVVKIVDSLLRRPEPPSIGIACFNLTQRDLILDQLAEFAESDQDFGDRLAAARNRVGAGAFEGLFVKNLENVQGDERDQMIICTTYGPDKQGKFFRRFGPLGQAGGGRRLNVLVTRAREEVHLITSIPANLYRSLPSIPEGQQPGGGWLLFAYLNYAEQLAQSYNERRSGSSGERAASSIRVVQRPSHTPSKFAAELGRLVANLEQMSSDVHWGNDGFCIDVAFHHPQHTEERTLGVICDGTRFQYADDPVAWDVFRMSILDHQGWQIRRCWSPDFFRDPEGTVRQLASQAKRITAEENASGESATGSKVV